MVEGSKKFSFISLGMPGDTFGVVRFKGSEGLSRIYYFEIDLVSKDSELDLNEVIQNPARFSILREEGDISFNGMLIEFEQMHQVQEYSFYKALLVPKIWWLSQTRHNQIFLDKSIPQILEDVLKDGGLDENDFELRLKEEYRKWEYVCQYRETHLNFVQRWMEREGIYFYFEQTRAGEKLILTDTNMAHGFMQEGQVMYYSPPSGLDFSAREEIIKDFCCRQKILPKSLRLKDYNYERPSLNVEGMADVYSEGRGEVYMYGDHFKNTEEGNKLAEVRAEELKCWEKTFHGESTIPFMRPGYRFSLQDHYRKSFNQNYLTVELSHEGSQAAFMLAGLTTELSDQEEKPYYWNSFTALPADVQFRPRRETEKPRFYGSLNARIDAAGSGKYAEIDEQGRYKVILPFDRSGRLGGKASTWLRMMQPYAGPNQGMHFPLHKGTEVLLTFIDGDPDRPIIAGAVPNPETKSPVTDKNQTKSVIQTGRNRVEQSAGADKLETESDLLNMLANNFIEIEDAADKEHIYLQSPGNLWREALNRYGEYHAKEYVNDGAEPKINDLLNNFCSDKPSYNPTGMLDRHNTNDSQSDFYEDVLKNGHLHVSSLDTVTTQEGNIYDFGGYWNYNLGNSYVEEHMDQCAKLNAVHTNDLLDQGGPYWKNLKFSELAKGDLSASSDIQIGSSSDWEKDNSGNTSVWVEKTFGNAYSYNDGHQICVNKGDTLEVQHGGKHVEVVFREPNDDGTQGSIKSWNWSSGGESKEKKWTGSGIKVYEGWSKPPDSSDRVYDRNTGDLMTYSTKSNTGGGLASFDFGFCAKASAAFDFGFASSFAFSASESVGINIKVARCADINIGFVSSFELKTGIGIGMELDLRAGGTLKLEHDGLQFDGIGFTARKEAALKAEKAALKAEKAEARLRKMEANIEANNISIDAIDVELEDCDIGLHTAMVTLFQ